MNNHLSRTVTFSLLLIVLGVVPRISEAQLNSVFTNLFDDILRSGFVKSPGEHGKHFKPAAELAGSELAPALGRLISGNVASFPLTSTVAGVTFDPSTGQTITESLGPIFSEPVETLGSGNVSVGVNATYLSMDRFRGLPTRDMRFSFTHEDVGLEGLGDSANESDVMDLFLDLDVNATIVAFYGTFGLTNRLDFGIAVPFVNVSMKGDVRAVMNSRTFLTEGQANHFFDGDSLNPVLEKFEPYDVSSGGVGDVSLRLKYRFTGSSARNGLAAIIDVRVPTGDEKDFLGTGNTTASTLLLGSIEMGDFTPHVNVGYNYRNAEDDSDEFLGLIGFDQRLSNSFSFALDLMSRLDLDSIETLQLFPGTTTIDGALPIVVDRSNIPERTNDDRIDLSFGFRYAPILGENVQLQFLGNIIVPLQDGGLRSDIAPTFGLAFSF